MADDELRSDLANAADPTKGATLVGYTASGSGAIAQTVRSALDQQEVNARSFGFSESATGAVNATAIRDALIAANGRKVIVESDVDYQGFQFSVANPLPFDIDLEFRGGGRMLRSNTGGICTVTGGWFGVQPVISIVDTSVAINNVTEAVTRLEVSDVGEYQIGDMIRVVSDDIDPNARERYSARRGEAACVVQTDSSQNYIYIARTLEDQAYYVTNVRVGRYSRHRVKVTGLKVAVADNNTSKLIGFNAIVQPYVELETYNHAATSLEFCGCVDGTAIIHCQTPYSGTSSSGSKILTYAFTDKNGTRNTLRDSVCSGQRHMVTTSFNTVAEDSAALHLYGAPKDLKVIDCTSTSSQNVPFDEHEGARRTQFIRCTASGAMVGTNNSRSAFQLRGSASQVIDARVDPSYDYGVNPTSFGTSEAKLIQGGTYRCAHLVRSVNDTPSAYDLVIDSVLHQPMHLNTEGFLTSHDTRMFVKNSRFESFGTSNENPRFLQSRITGLIHIENCEFVIANQENTTNLQCFNVGENGIMIGRGITIREMNGNPLDYLFSFSTSGTGRIDMELALLQGEFTRIKSSTSGAEIRYTITDYTQTPAVMMKSLDAIVLSSADPVNNGTMSFTLTSNTSLRIKVRGSDGVVRTADVPLASAI